MTPEEIETAYPGIEHLYRDDDTFWIMVEAMSAHDPGKSREHHAFNLSLIVADLASYSKLPLFEIVTEKFGYPVDLFNADYLEAKRGRIDQ